MDPSKIQSMFNWPIPRNIKELHGFLGLTVYYQKFIRNYARIAFPLTEHLKKENYGWSDRATLAFEILKYALVTAPVLKMPDFTAPFILETDTSGMD